MSIFRDLVAMKAYSMEDFDNDIRRYLYGNKVKSGINVNEETAMRFTAVFGCIRILSETLASVPLIVYRRRSDGGKERATDHRMYELLHNVPNDEMPSMYFRETLQGHICSSGNGYALITRNRRGEVIELYPWPWTDITPVRNPDTQKIEYHINDRGKTEILLADRVFHIPGLGFDGIKGYSPIRMAQEAVGLGLAAEAFGALFFRNGTNLGGILEVPGVLSDQAYDRLRASFKEKYTGIDNSHKIILLEEGTKFNKLGIPPEEAQFIETRRFQKEEIASIYRVPLHLLQNYDRATHSNVEQLSLEFVKYTMLPWFVRWEQFINFKLFTRREREQGYFAEFLVDGLLRGDAKSRAEALHIMRQNGIINADEWRALENMNPQEGGTGKVYLVNGNMIPVHMAGHQQNQQAQEGGDDSSGEEE
ncbi:MAG: phage portal protein [Thermoanaerobacteraceae bacterium]|nr:phage portal protein [Thermoanaerobacteraceae bacterium]